MATTGQVFLGMTIDCARCHDHKIDPIPQKDYYKLVAFFQNVNDFRNGGPTDEFPIFANPEAKAAYHAKVRELERQQRDVRNELAAIENAFLSKDSPGQEGEVRRPDLDELRYSFYRDTWDKLPDFPALKPEETGDLPSGLFDLRPRTRDDAFGFVFEGVLVVPQDGNYTFALDSDDGSRLSLSGALVIEYDGVHEAGQPRTAEVKLGRGRVPIRLEYFQKESRLRLSVSWSGPGFARRALSASGRDRNPADLPQLIKRRGEKVLRPERLARYRALRRELTKLDLAKPEVETVLCVTERGPSAPETFVLLRGNAHAPGDKVEPGFLQVLRSPIPAVPTPKPGSKTSGRRALLANWVTSADNPLTARVIANRVWQHHFGRGIVRSSNNFGTQGDKPTHPELLDWLTSELVGGGWRLKALHRLMMTSNTYKMSSRTNPESLAKDPANDGFWRFDMRRLTAEELRDSVLAVSGNLNPKMYGPGVYPLIPREVMAGQSIPGYGWGKSSPEEQARRSVYVHVKRSLLLPILESHDVAETDRSTPNRFSTTQPTQALAMLNGKFANVQAETLAGRLRREAGAEPSAQVRLAFRLVTAREPRSDEVRRGLDLISAFDTARPGEGLKAFSLVALNLNEFLFLD